MESGFLWLKLTASDLSQGFPAFSLFTAGAVLLLTLLRLGCQRKKNNRPRMVSFVLKASDAKSNTWSVIARNEIGCLCKQRFINFYNLIQSVWCFSGPAPVRESVTSSSSPSPLERRGIWHHKNAFFSAKPPNNHCPFTNWKKPPFSSFFLCHPPILYSSVEHPSGCWWDAALLMGCLLKPMRCSNLLS